MRAWVFPALWLWLLIAVPLTATAAPDDTNPYLEMMQACRDNPSLPQCLQSPPEKTPLDRIIEKAIIGGGVGAIIVLPFGAVRLIRDLRAVKQQRGHLVTYRARLAIAGSLLWFMLVYVIGRAFAPDWYYEASQFDTIFFGPPVVAVIGALLWSWVRKVKPPA